MNPWTQHLNRELFNLVEPLWCRTVLHPTRPPKSPYMNITEPIWVVLQCAVQKRSPPPGTPMDFRTALQDSWCEIPPGYLQTLVDTMPRRVASLLCARVGPKRY
ncbi:hypothetical protein AVEN_78742-1 [Araneus ventricosus]|uniref:Tc1-like transposase DDE domain-containing protein n=1 Tax=Araneus ventricosus TaxID=182803 RepID=A0A4Y2T7D7_ARAVE|nr:hypothetical protein AVEN_78742-1 [Araneus ventricosus]